jgi:hypothetical protein
MRVMTVGTIATQLGSPPAGGGGAGQAAASSSDKTLQDIV